MTFLELQDLVLSWLDDPDAGYFTRPQVKTWVNNAQTQVQKLIDQAFEGHFIKTSETTTVSGQREYQLPTDFKRLHRLELVLDGGSSFQNQSRQMLMWISPNQQDSFARQGTPEAYYFKGKQLILVPVPDVTKTLRMDYAYRLTDMSNDADVSEIPIEHHELMAILATIDGLVKDGRETANMIAKRDEWIKMLKQDAEQRNADMPRTIVQTETDDFDIYPF